MRWYAPPPIWVHLIPGRTSNTENSPIVRRATHPYSYRLCGGAERYGRTTSTIADTVLIDIMGTGKTCLGLDTKHPWWKICLSASGIRRVVASDHKLNALNRFRLACFHAPFLLTLRFDFVGMLNQILIVFRSFDYKFSERAWRRTRKSGHRASLKLPLSSKAVTSLVGIWEKLSPSSALGKLP